MSQVRSKAYSITRANSRSAVQEAVRRVSRPGYADDLESINEPFGRGSYRNSIDGIPGLSQHAESPLLAGRASGPAAEVHWWIRDSAALKEILFGNWINLLLLVVPLGMAAGYLEWPATWVFVLNFIALVPLALILGDVTEDMALRYGSIVGGLINATFGNVVEVILSIAALLNGLYDVVTASLLGSILSNLLLVLGCSFFFGGLYNKTQKFNATGNQTCSSLLFLASVGFLIPTAANMFFDDSPAKAGLVLDISHGTAIALFICYICYLGFQLYTHTDLFEEEDNEDGGDHEEPMLSVFTSVTLLTLITVTVAVASEYLTSSIEEFSHKSGLGKAFVSTIILPIAGNACEHLTAVIVAMKNKMDLAMGVAVGSGIQIALFAIPFVVIVGWVTGHPFSLSFDPFSAVALLLAVCQSNFVTSGALSHWLLGVQLIALYIIISIAYLFKE